MRDVFVKRHAGDEMPRASFYTPTELSERISETPEGYLICRDVVIARTGTQEYTPDELEMDDDGLGVIEVERAADEVFSDDAIASFEGKPVTVGHPDDFVKPQNWKEHAAGFVRDVRRGEGDQNEYLLATLVITDETAITLVKNGLRELSCGYEANYLQDAPGKARQSEIRGNHVALVSRGRCGGACAIQDQRTEMPKKQSAWERLLATFKVKDAKELEARLTSDEDDGQTHDCGCATKDEGDKANKVLAAFDQNNKLLTKLIGVIAKDAKGSKDDDDDDDDDDKDGQNSKKGEAGGEGGESGGADNGEEAEDEHIGWDAMVKKLMEQGHSKEAAQKIAGKIAKEKGEDAEGNDLTVAETAEKADVGKTYTGKGTGDAKPLLPEAEILSPGIKINDGESVREFQRRALDAALLGDHTSAVLGLMDKAPAKMNEAELNLTFKAASRLIGQINNVRATDGPSVFDADHAATSIDAINKANRDFWKANGGLQ